jgi:4-hydroxybenzoate polyprenyltransferase
MTKVRIPYQALIRIMRPRHWVKNIFVLVPLLFSGVLYHCQAVLQALFATCLFCIASSAAYILNDIYDKEQDSLHPYKAQTRPLAAGTLSTAWAFALLLGLYISVLASYLAMPRVTLVLIAYILLNIAYTLVLKYYPVVDIFIVAMGFVLRVYAGALALHVPVSSWMFLTTLCLSLYLAAIKRGQELRLYPQESRVVLQKYRLSLIERYAQISSIGALLSYSMFVTISTPQLVITVPLVLFGLFRYWYVVEMYEEGESPIDAILQDGQLMGTILLWVLVCIAMVRL